MSGSTGSTGTSTAGRMSQLRRRVLTADDGAPRTFQSAIDGAPRWAAGVAAGLQAAILSLAVIVVPTIAAYVVTSADPANADVGWLRSVAVGTGIWLLAHGVPLQADGIAVTLTPLGITLLAGFTCYAAAKRSGYAAWSGFAAAVGAYLAVVLGATLLIAGGPTAIVRAVVGGVIVGGVGLGAGLLSRPEAPRLRDLSRPLWIRVPGAVRAAIAAGVLAAALLVAGAAVVLVGWIVAGRESVLEVSSSLGLDAIGGAVLALGQLAFVPDLVGWAVAFVAGPGFVVGAGSHFTATAIVSGPLPAVPLLGALPGPGTTDPLMAWFPIVLVIIGAVAGGWMHQRLPRGGWWHPLLAAGTAAGVAGVAIGLFVAVSSGSGGPGRMTEIGASGLLVGLTVAVGTAIGFLVVVLPASVEVRAAARAGWRRLRRVPELTPEAPGRQEPGDAPSDPTISR